MAEEEKQQLSDDKGSESVFDFYCEFCREDGKMLEAEGYCVNCGEYLCDTCYTCHRRSRGNRHHVLIDKDQMPKDTPLSHDHVNKDISKMCDNHPGEPVKYYCKSHDCLGCSICFIEGHRNCNIETITKVSESIMDSEEFKSFIEMLKQFDKRSRNNIQLVKDNILKSKSWCAEVVKAVQKFKAEINSVLDELEKTILTQAEILQIKEETKLMNVFDNFKTSLESVAKIIGELDHLQKSNKVCEIYIELKESTKEAVAVQTKLTEAERENVISEYIFDPNTKLLEFLKQQNGLGKLSVQTYVTADVMVLPHSNSANTNATLLTDIVVKSTKDEYNCSITGSAVISNNRLIMVDYINVKVKLIDTQSNKVISELTVSSTPWDVTVINRNQAAVTLYWRNKILLLSVSDTLTLDREIYVDGSCRGVAYTKNRLVVTYVDPGRLTIMDLSGKVNKIVQNDRDRNELCAWPQYVCVSKDEETMYVSDFDSNKVTSLTLDGVEKSVYSDSKLKSARKVCVDHHGNVYVCGYNSRNVHMLTADLTKIQIILTQADGLDSCVYSVSHCQETNRLYVGMESNNKVKVYQL